MIKIIIRRRRRRSRRRRKKDTEPLTAPVLLGP